MVVQEVCHLTVDRVTSDGEVDTELHAGDFFLKSGNVNLRIFELFQQFKVNFL